METIRLSWSILSTWSAGRQDEAIKMLMGYGETNKYMEEGSRIHNLIAKQKLILLPFMDAKTGRWELPDTKDRRKDPNYARVQVLPWLIMSFKMDYVDISKELLIDFKSGSRKSTEHNKLQGYVYAYLCTLLPEPIKIKTFVICKVGEDSSGAILCEDFSTYVIDDNKLAIAQNYIESNASEIFNMLQEIGKK